MRCSGRRVPGAGDGGDRVAVALLEAHAHGGAQTAVLRVGGQRVVQAPQDRAGLGLVGRCRAHRVPRHRRDRRGVRALAGDVADDDHPAALDREQVVEVAADLRRLPGRAEARGDRQPRQVGEPRRQQAALQRHGDVGAGGVDAGVLHRDAGAAPELLGEPQVALPEHAPRVARRGDLDRPERPVAGSQRDDEDRARVDLAHHLRHALVARAVEVRRRHRLPHHGAPRCAAPRSCCGRRSAATGTPRATRAASAFARSSWATAASRRTPRSSARSTRHQSAMSGTATHATLCSVTPTSSEELRSLLAVERKRCSISLRRASVTSSTTLTAYDAPCSSRTAVALTDQHSSPVAWSTGASAAGPASRRPARGGRALAQGSGRRARRAGEARPSAGERRGEPRRPTPAQQAARPR